MLVQMCEPVQIFGRSNSNQRKIFWVWKNFKPLAPQYLNEWFGIKLLAEMIKVAQTTLFLSQRSFVKVTDFSLVLR